MASRVALAPGVTSYQYPVVRSIQKKSQFRKRFFVDIPLSIPPNSYPPHESNSAWGRRAGVGDSWGFLLGVDRKDLARSHQYLRALTQPGSPLGALKRYQEMFYRRVCISG